MQNLGNKICQGSGPIGFPGSVPFVLGKVTLFKERISLFHSGANAELILQSEFAFSSFLLVVSL